MTPTPGVGPSPSELTHEAERFGVSDDQVRRDHAISHVLAALSERAADDVVFFGGTALSRTHLIHARLSEDIDLIAIGPRADAARRVSAAIEAGLLRSHGRVTWRPGFTAEDIEPALLEVPVNISIRVQLLDGRHYSKWPTERRTLDQRYSDVAPSSLTVPTIESFAGWKTAAWHDRRTARDLYDLWALAERDALTTEAAALFARHGTTGGPPRSFMFDRAPSDAAWEAQLAGQTRLEVTAGDALGAVRAAWSRALGENWDD